MSELRLVSLLPSGTELACALGLEDRLVGVSHECNYPVSVKHKPVVVHSAVPVREMDLAEIDQAVSGRLARGESLYEVDVDLLRELAPTHLLTQDLCQVCAPAGGEVARALRALPRKPEVLWMSPHSVAEIHQDLRNLGRMTGREAEAELLIAASRARLDACRSRRRIHAGRGSTRALPVRRIFCAEWIDPLYCCGHWVPEMVEIAGGIDVAGRKWKDSVRVLPEAVIEKEPEVIVVMPCGFDLEASTEQAGHLLDDPVFEKHPAEVYAVDAVYFSRPGLRVVEGTELLAHLLHPEIHPWNGPKEAFRKVRGFTLIELLVVIAVIGILAGLLMPVLSKARASGYSARCMSNLRQFGLATAMYWDDNDGECFRYRGGPKENGMLYWFGWIGNGTEGTRALDLTQGVLWPYINGRGIEICPAFKYGSQRVKLKAVEASHGYGYNLFLSSSAPAPPRRIDEVPTPASTLLFADAAQVNTWQAPASPLNPMVEEWYYIDDGSIQPNGHFRHKERGQAVFVDGHVAAEKAVPGSYDARLIEQRIGRYRTEILRWP